MATFKTRFNIEDEVCFIKDNELIQSIVSEIHVYQTNTETNVIYGLGVMVDGELKTAVLKPEAEVAVIPYSKCQEV